MALRDLFVRMGVHVDQKPLLDAQRNVNGLVIRFAQLRRIASFALAAIGLGQLTESADRYINLHNRLQSVTEGLEEYGRVEEGVFNNARKTFTDVEAQAELFQRYSRVLEQTGKSNEDLLDFTHRLSQAMRLGGATAAETRGALVQLAQGMATNFQSAGQEIRSVQENSTILANIIAKSAGGTRAQLMQLAKSGKLTAKAIFDAVRNEGAELDKQWAKRIRSFEDIRKGFGTEWLWFFKQMLPAIKKITGALLDWIRQAREWVRRGEAMNTVIALLIVVVGTLTVAFGSLAASILATVAPFIGLFLLLEDFVTFMRGGDSLFGRMFDELGKLFGVEDGTDEARQGFKRWFQIVMEFLKLLGKPEELHKIWDEFWHFFMQDAAEAFEWLDTKMQELSNSLRQFLRDVLGKRVSGFLGIGEQEEEGSLSERQQQAQRESDERAKRGYKLLQVIEDGFVNTLSGFADWMAGDQPAPKSRTLGVSITSAPTMDINASRRAVGASAAATQASSGAAPQVTNNITVQGNASAQTAREIAHQTGRKTAVALGRDRSAIGATVGAE